MRIGRKSLLVAMLLVGAATCNGVLGIQEPTKRECLTADDCMVGVSKCVVAAECVDTVCQFDYIVGDIKAQDQEDGDCGTLTCKEGQLIFEPNTRGTQEYSKDIPDDHNPCTLDECIGTTPRHVPITDTEVPCYDGPPNSQDKGICKAGVQHCEGGTRVGDCKGQILPGIETCLSELDEDCDGNINDHGLGCKCKPNQPRSCYSGPNGTQGVGKCNYGTQICSSDGLGYGPCEGDQVPMVEVCDALMLDEDCDGESNEEGICICGDGVLSPGEDCDDGNTQNGDTCPSDCHIGALQIWAGGRRTCVLLENRMLKCWGDNEWGGLGTGTVGDHRGDGPMEMGKDLPSVGLGTSLVIAAAAMGRDHTCVVFDNESTKCWGFNESCQCGKLYDFCDNVWGDGQPSSAETIDMLPLVGIPSITQAAAGTSHSCVLTQLNAVQCWGNNISGQVGVGTIP